MTNKEIDIRLKALADQIPAWVNERKRQGQDQIVTELEGISMSLMAVWAMLGEIAKRLPEDTFQYQSSVNEPVYKSWENSRWD